MVKCNPHLLNVSRDSDILEDRDDFVCLDMNERVSPFSDEIFSEIISKLSPKLFTAYPDLGPLYEKLSGYTGLPTEQICVGAGSDGLIRRTFQAFLSPGEQVVVTEPTYGMYNIWTQIFNAKVIPVQYEKNLKLDVDKFVAQINDATGLVAIANPDQPIGAKLSIEDLKRIAAAAEKKDALFLIDEAYQPLDIAGAQKLIDKYTNVLVIRTFSKYCGLAGLRIGFAFGSSRIISAIQKVRSPGEVNSIGALVACHLLDNPDIVQKHFSDLEKGRKIVIESAFNLGYEAPECFGNFQILKVPEGISPHKLKDLLKKHGFLIKSGFTQNGLENYIRITLDTPSTMNSFCEKISLSTNTLLSETN